MHPALPPRRKQLHLARMSSLISRPWQPHHKHQPRGASMDDVWSWLAALPDPANWPSASPSLTLASVTDGRSIALSADRTAGSNSDTLLTLSLTLHGFPPSAPSRALWLSDPLPPSAPHFPLVSQLLSESISLSPSPSALAAVKLAEDRVAGALSEADKSTSALLCLALLLRLFWLCATDAPADAGFLFFRALDEPLERALVRGRHALRGVLLALGPDMEEQLMRSLGYMLCKWCILRDLQQGGCGAAPSRCPSYAAERHGLWVMKGFAPVPAMARVGGAGGPGLDAKESLLRYALAHQQLEAVVQLEYTVCARDSRFIRVSVRVNNIRLHVVRLRFGRDKEGGEGEGGEGEGEEEAEVDAERHFPSRARVWVGPDQGASYATGPSLGRSSGNPEREVESARTVKGRFGGGKAAGVKATARTAARARGRSWRWEQEAEGGAGVFEGVLCDGATGAEVAAWRPAASGGGDPRGGMRRRYSGWGRAFSKAGGVVVAGDELVEAVEWRVGREMEGKAVKWRIGARVWVSYLANEVKTGYFETRSVEWKEEVDLPLLPTTSCT